MNCGICGKAMAKFLNPTRYECTNTSSHAAILAAAKASTTSQARNTGQARPKSKDNLSKKKGDSNKKGGGKK